jgi:glycosyltransferase involved in cell wall biosynthesis
MAYVGVKGPRTPASRKRRVLHISTNHASIRPGGVECYLRDLYTAFRHSDEFEPLYISRVGAPYGEATRHDGGTPFAMVGDDPNEYLFYTDTFSDLAHYDRLFVKWTPKAALRWFSDFLVAQQPDVVHFHQVVHLGVDMIRAARNALPAAPIVFTLHEYVPICHNDGQMVRTIGNELCSGESPRRCHECFPDVTPQTFFMRKRFIQSQMSLVDHFIAPIEHCRRRYVRWGIPPEKIVVEPQGMMPVSDREPDAEGEHRPRNRFGYFGVVSTFKGTDVLLEAMNLVTGELDGHLWIHGANLDLQGSGFRQGFADLLEPVASSVTFAGPYEREALGRLMAGIDWVVVPSIFEETGPLIVLEAFLYGRPVICSDFGGMAEKVADGVNGLHFGRGDPADLARTMLRAAGTPGLWETLREGIPDRPPRWMDEHVDALSDIYRRLLSKAGA